jgi:hypothetical protein
VVDMAVAPEVIHPPIPRPDRRRRATVERGSRRASTGGEAIQGTERPSAPFNPATTATSAAPERSASTWGGLAILVVPTVGLFGMVAAVVVVNEVDHWWALVPAMSFALISTLLVMATVMRMMGESD